MVRVRTILCRWIDLIRVRVVVKVLRIRSAVVYMRAKMEACVETLVLGEMCLVIDETSRCPVSVCKRRCEWLVAVVCVGDDGRVAETVQACMRTRLLLARKEKRERD